MGSSSPTESTNSTNSANNATHCNTHEALPIKLSQQARQSRPPVHDLLSQIASRRTRVRKLSRTSGEARETERPRECRETPNQKSQERHKVRTRAEEWKRNDIRVKRPHTGERRVKWICQRKKQQYIAELDILVSSVPAQPAQRQVTQVQNRA